MTQQQIAATLRPPWPTTAHPLLGWCADLIAARGWSVRLGGRFAALRRQHLLEVRPLSTDADVAAVLHECGHVADPRERPRLREDFEPDDVVVGFDSECFAWLWAFRTAGRRWTPEMQEELEFCLESYARVYSAAVPVGYNPMAATRCYTRRCLEQRAVVSLRPNPVPVPLVLRSLLFDIQEAPCQR